MTTKEIEEVAKEVIDSWTELKSSERIKYLSKVIHSQVTEACKPLVESGDELLQSCRSILITHDILINELNGYDEYMDALKAHKERLG